MNISAVCIFVLSQSTRVMFGRREGQNYDPQSRTITAVPRGKMRLLSAGDMHGRPVLRATQSQNTLPAAS